jgi:hypothetical protein
MRLNEISDRFNKKFQRTPTPTDEAVFVETEGIKFISALDSKPVQPPYLKLMSLKQYRKMIHDEKQQQEPGQNVTSAKKSLTRSNQIKSIEKTEYDDMIRSL